MKYKIYYPDESSEESTAWINDKSLTIAYIDDKAVYFNDNVKLSEEEFYKLIGKPHLLGFL